MTATEIEARRLGNPLSELETKQLAQYRERLHSRYRWNLTKEEREHYESLLIREWWHTPGKAPL